MADDIPAGFTLDAPAPAAGADIPAGFKLDETSQDREKKLRAQYGKEIAQHGEPGYAERFIDAATMGVSRPLSGAVRAVGGMFDPDTTAGERYRAGNAAADEYFRKGEENTAGAGGFATDVAGALVAPPVGKVATLGRTALTGGRELLGRLIAQGATTGAVEGAARNSQDVGSAVEGAATGAGLGAAGSAAVGGASKLIPGVKGAQAAAREANQGIKPDELKAAAKPLFQQLDQGGIAYAQPQTRALKDGLDELIANNKYNPEANPTLKGYVDQLGKLATQPQGAKFTELNNIRSALAEQARGPDPSTRRAAGEIMGHIDDLVLKNKPAINPNGVDVGPVHEEARKLWKAAMVADDVGYTAGRAERKVASKSGVNPDEANRGAFRPLLEKTEKPGAYSPFGSKGSEQHDLLAAKTATGQAQSDLLAKAAKGKEQRELLAKIVQGDKLQNTYRNLGAVAGSPVTRGILGLAAGAVGLHTGGLSTLAGALGGGAAGGGAAKAMLDRAAASRGAVHIDELLRNITGSSPKAIPPEAMRTLLAKQFAQRGGAAYTASKTGEKR